MRPELALILIFATPPLWADPMFAPVPDLPDHIYEGGWEHFVGGGVAVFDCDGDHRPDFFAAGGAAPSQLLRNVPGDQLRFESATPAALDLTSVTGAYPLDIDSDGMTDLAVMRVGPDVLLRGLPDCQFAPFDELEFQSADHWTTAFSATWEVGQSLPTLAFGSYVDRSDPEGPFEACDRNWLYRPDGVHYPTPEPLEPGYCALSVLFSDWGRTGRADLRISNDRHYYVRDGQEQLWAMEDSPRLYTEADGWAKFNLWGMGIASRDLTGDGRPEIYLSSMGDQRLQEPVPGAAGPAYRDVPYDQGTTAHRPHTGEDGRPSTGWHIAFGDVNNDGRDDVFIAKGNVDQMPGLAMSDPNSLLMQQTDGRFREASVEAGVASSARSRGAALVDFDLDGRLDLVVVNRRAPLEIYHNVTPAVGNWLSVSLAQPGPNPTGVGAWIEVRLGDRILSREVTVGGGHASGTWAPAHFGLGDAEWVDLRVVWPDGWAGPWAKLKTNTQFTVTRP